jgi:hypothetical protein
LIFRGGIFRKRRTRRVRKVLNQNGERVLPILEARAPDS